MNYLIRGQNLTFEHLFVSLKTIVSVQRDHIKFFSSVKKDNASLIFFTRKIKLLFSPQMFRMYEDIHRSGGSGASRR